jgi:death on curing protein
MNDPLFLTLDEVLQLHAESLEHFGGAEGVRDMGLIESAIATPRQAFGGQYLHPSLASMAAAYLFHIASNHGFVDGNKRTGARAAYVFLAINGCEVDLPLDETEQVVLGVAKGSITKEQVTEFLEKLLK